MRKRRGRGGGLGHVTSAQAHFRQPSWATRGRRGASEREGRKAQRGRARQGEGGKETERRVGRGKASSGEARTPARREGRFQSACPAATSTSLRLARVQAQPPPAVEPLGFGSPCSSNSNSSSIVDPAELAIPRYPESAEDRRRNAL